jgi:hypothetical protein
MPIYFIRFITVVFYKRFKHWNFVSFIHNRLIRQNRFIPSDYKDLFALMGCVYIYKVKLSRFRPGQALGVPGVWGSRIFRQSAQEGGKVVSPTHRPSLPPGRALVLISVRGWVDPRATMRPQGLNHWKIPVTPSGIGPATFRRVAQCFNQLRHRVPHIYIYSQ